MVDSRQPTRLREAEELFFRALELPASERREFVSRCCGSDDFLRETVENLLDADRQDGFLSAPAAGSEFVLPSPEDLRDMAQRRRIGPYELGELLGSGGIGHVWAARRVDGQFEHAVAIKLIKRGMDTDAIVAAFQNERQVLARLEHPNIARILDGGVTDDGLPYLVMERVDGVPIDVYCREQRLALRQRIGLFQLVCDAVAHAHRSLIVHRDLKPGNILVTPDGRPVLLDFGIAKVLDSDAAGTAALTRAGRLMTPEYASPEQLLGQPVGTASDVYSLGVVLYELLTTAKPYDAATGATKELERMVCEEEPPRPSSRVLALAGDAEARAGWPEGGASRWARALTGDLDTVLATALRKRPEERYSSVENFADDLRRVLQQRPIEARPPTWAYLARRFVQRNSIGVTAASVALLAVLAALALSTSAYLRAAEDRTRAEASAQRALAVNAFLERLLITDDPANKLRDDVTLRDLLAEATRVVDSGELSELPAVEAAVRATLGRTYVHLKMAGSGEGHYRRALELMRELHGPRNLEVAGAMGDLGGCLCEQAKFEEGLPLQLQCLELLRELAPEDEEAIARRLLWVSTALRDTYAYERSEQAAREALEIASRLKGPRGELTAHARFRLGWILGLAGKPAQAVPELLVALEIQRQVLGAGHSACGETMLVLGRVSAMMDEEQEAERWMRASVDNLERSIGATHPRTGRASGHLARLLAKRESWSEAERWYALTLERKQEYLGRKQPNVLELEWANVKRRAGDVAGAERVLRETLTIVTGPDGDPTGLAPRASLDLAELLAEQSRYAEAEAVLVQCIERAAPGARALECMQALVAVYEAWMRADPSPVLERRAASWQRRLAAGE